MPFESVLTVVSPATIRDLTTVAKAAAECGVTVDAFAGSIDLIAAASDAIVAFTKREWVQETVRQTFRGDGRKVSALFLERAPVSSITSVTVDGTSLNLSTEIELDPKAHTLHRLDLDCRIEWGCRVVVVEYVAGYIPPGLANSNMPALIQRAAAKIVAGWRAGQGRDPRLRSRTIEDVGSASWVDHAADEYGMPPGIAALLGPHQWKRAG